MSYVQIVLKTGDLHPIKTNTFFKDPHLSNIPWWLFECSEVREIAVPNHAKIPWGKSTECSTRM
jgi:hypothetical protein